MNAPPGLLAEGRRFGAEYGGGLSNHLPMALVALQQLCAEGLQLARFAAHDGQRLEVAPPAVPAGPDGA